ncbi:MAG: hypothetical protein OIF58_13760 [Cohaesibacter sp.]|nr:hypothetical protein [Cohaesibacter sp.]
MVDDAKTPFRDASLGIPPKEEVKEPDAIRDKDNADRRISPPSYSPSGEKNRAPKGMSGVKRDLPSPEKQKAKRFDIREPGSLKREFKSIAKGQSKDRGWER